MQTLEQYTQEGFAKFKGKLSLDAVAILNNSLDKLVETLDVGDHVFEESSSGKIKQIQYLHKKDVVFQNLVDNLAPIAEKLSGETKFKVLNVQMFEKHPEISKPTRSHQDNAYFQVQPPIAMTFWIALDDIDDENGALYYAPKTHLTPTRKHVRYHPHTTFRVRSGVPGLSLCLKEHPEETDEIMIVNAGDVLVHNCNLIHRAGKNNSKRRRRAIGIVFIPESCTIDPRLRKYHDDRLKEDVELQKYKDSGASIFSITVIGTKK